MQKIAFALVCLIIEGTGRRVQTSSVQRPNSERVESKTPDALKKPARILPALHPVAAFSPSAAGAPSLVRTTPHDLFPEVLREQSQRGNHVGMMGKLKKKTKRLQTRPQEAKGFAVAKEKKVKLEIPQLRDLPTESQLRIDPKDLDDEEDENGDYDAEDEDVDFDESDFDEGGGEAHNMELIKSFLEKESAESEEFKEAGDSESEPDVDKTIDARQGDGDHDVPPEFQNLPAELRVDVTPEDYEEVLDGDEDYDEEDSDDEEYEDGDYAEEDYDDEKDIEASNMDLIKTFLEKGDVESKEFKEVGASDSETDIDAMIDAIQGDGDYEIPSEFRNLPPELRVNVEPEDYKEVLDGGEDYDDQDYDEMFDNDDDDLLKPGVVLSLDGEVDEDKYDNLLDHIEADANAMLKAANLSDRQLTVVVCDDKVIQEMNARWRSKDRPTDVLSFPADDDALVGDLIVSIPTAERQAAERGHSLRNEVRILLVHGFLHLCGFDHEESGEEHATMVDAEEVMMELLGWEGKGLVAHAENLEEEGASEEDIVDDKDGEFSLAH